MIIATESGQTSASTASPCIGVCSVTVGDNVCRGCFRTMDDIAVWSHITAAQRQARLSRRQALLESSFRDYFALLDAERLQQQWKKYIDQPPEPAFPVEAWVHLLHKGAHKIQNPEAYGVRVLSDWADQPLRRVWRTWRDQLLVELSTEP